MSYSYSFNDSNTEIIENGIINQIYSNNSMDILKNNNEEKIKETNEKSNNNKTENSTNPKNSRKRAFPTNCCVCGHIASGYVFYNAMCCDGAIKCKSCRFDKCILMGMNVMTLRGNNAEAFLEVHTFIKNRLKQLVLEGKIAGKNVEVNAFEVSNTFKETVISTGQDTQIIEFLLTIDKNVSQIRNSGINVPEWHYGYPCNSLEILLTRTENLISTSQEYPKGEHLYVPESFEFIQKYGLFKLRPSTLTEDLLLIVDTAKTMPFFPKLDLSDKICLLSTIAMPLVILAERQFSCNKKSETVMLPCGISLFDCYNGEHYSGDSILKKYVKRVFVDAMEPFNQVQLNEEEYVLIRAIIFSHMITEGLSDQGKQILQNEAENYIKILMGMLQVCKRVQGI
uniref:NR LBD domain-containing protein n=1 Tax=Meloidogyne hapla TaxID=6305 RepID=A0A1I8BJI5_MELHA